MSAVLPASAMRRVTCAELRELATAYRPALYYAAARCARETKIYLHWTAGHYGQFFADYHVQVDADGGIYVIGTAYSMTCLPRRICATAGASASHSSDVWMRRRKASAANPRPPRRSRRWRSRRRLSRTGSG